MFELKEVALIYETKKQALAALKSTDLKIEKGEEVGIFGPSGSGKSSLLFIMSTLKEPSRGEVKYEGKELTALTPSAKAELRRKEFGFVFQEHFLINHLTVRENILLPLKEKRGARKRLEEITTALGLNKLLKRFPYELSLGQSQMVAVARALIASPKVVFADEPTASLDDENGSRVIELLKSYCSKSGATLILVSHSSEIIGDFRRRLRVENGQVYEVGVNA
ncbi:MULTISPECIES: ABC transporter ATP-binding protein [unclassified Mesotoga]|uniref:ABC transporter ATP-binding protein n=1 Tax=unclassified Mesotoga TaxID=1184398 RepID=UPI000DA6A00F|nr:MULTISPECIES: ABC transporter ATP-binding protein [unclassified Mesotoga]PZC52141.1 peptide ABC transporter ATPase [Mesotoga sp. TolDC]